ncbi:MULTISPECIES: Phenylacetic acid catabolic protein [Geobacillus]|jgi:ring-1,2-phenylacetyl-CoA epoxidase subunit PaaA|uniref:Phenylacetic acid catabolic protein n=2 Tax=Geobacillus thermodenitrificans TaxID=33940 RepID=A0ABY9Q9G0_GEOTD|nr:MULTISPECIES: Phenylacetic acid catabolic protein [Geobacillus]ABO67253.1 Putative benzoyl-CoA oxygenase component A [Geobacillus thermodenitrificans NG80-2]ARA99520.1 phenylacetic acid catabolic [Geobacillus thermodenitrificans]ARP43048.1 phenylacetate-CoA oxygenasePaaI subunit [Geobacillus thermodenitrificans]ATO38894.1 phenylacetic acid catabolic [Geobacillus thermodenitrificans]KQB93093.1 phenylacetic acid catabolic family protein [Geobacillus sp. PA-3]
MDQAALLKEKVQNGFIVEGIEDMNEEYLTALKQTLTIVGDTELLSVPPLLTVYDQAPTLNSKITALAIMQDEIGHAHIAYRLLKDLGEDVDRLLYEREAHRWKNPYAFDFELSNWIELGVFNAFFDRAGYTLLGDAFEHTSYGPWKRALVKVDKEELFHLRNGEIIMRTAMQDPNLREEVQKAVDWMFLMALEFFGVEDRLKSRSAQLEYRLKGRSNDELRQKWLSTAVPFCESIGVKVPAHYDEEQQKYVLDVPFPCKFDPVNKKWLFDQPDTWDNVIKRFKQRGPKNKEFVARIQKGAKELEQLRKEAV